MPTPEKAYVITGPTSGIGLETALVMAKHGTLVLVGRSKQKLDDVKEKIVAGGGKAFVVVANMSDFTSARRAADEIGKLDLDIAGVLNNAGIQETVATKTASGLDNSFATNHLGPFAFTEALLPKLPDGANVVFTCSAVENPERGPAKVAGFRGGRYLSAEASSRGEWKPGGAKHSGFDAYATSKQCNLATVLWLARHETRLHVNGVEPGFTPGTNLGGRQASWFVRNVLKPMLNAIAPYIKYWSTPKLSALTLEKVLLNDGNVTGVYFDEKARPMRGSDRVHDSAFQDRVVDETRALLASLHPRDR